MRKQNGFTFIELLIVIAIIAVLIMIIYPHYFPGPCGSPTTVCLSNTSALTKGWILYHLENKDALIGGDIGQSEFDWISKPVVADQTDIKGQKTNIQKGKLWPYVKNIVTVQAFRPEFSE